jgi:hypothetical protein
MWRSIWNGPFYIGPLERPISVGDVLMKVLETLWRTGLVIVGLATTLLVLVLGWTWKTSEDQKRALQQIQISVRYAPDICGEDRPLLVTLTNDGRQKVSSLSYSVSISDASGRDVAPAHFLYISFSEEVPGRSFKTDCLTPWQNAYGSDAYFAGYPQPATLSARVNSARY